MGEKLRPAPLFNQNGKELEETSNISDFLNRVCEDKSTQNVRDYRKRKRRQDESHTQVPQTLVLYNTKNPKPKIKERVNPEKKEDSLWETDLKAPQKIQAALKKENEGKGKDQGQEQTGSEEMLADLGESLNCPMRERKSKETKKPETKTKSQETRKKKVCL